MPASQRKTVYFSPELFRALKVKAAMTDRSLSDLVNEAVQHSLREDAIDVRALRHRAKEPGRAFSKVVRDLKRARLL
ncbi:MAG: CopG family transcriptional regulator [Candidatus Acidiferrales bacterium]